MSSGRDLVALPKVDLHVHLEGSMRPGTVVELAERYGVDLSGGPARGPVRVPRLPSFRASFAEDTLKARIEAAVDEWLGA